MLLLKVVSRTVEIRVIVLRMILAVCKIGPSCDGSMKPPNGIVGRGEGNEHNVIGVAEPSSNERDRMRQNLVSLSRSPES